MRYLLFCNGFLILIACSKSDFGLSSKRIKIGEKNKRVIRLSVPTGDTGMVKVVGYHGYSFSFSYIDSSFIYIVNDKYAATPNQFDCYEFSGYVVPVGGFQSDTILAGKQANGKYWKEVFQKGFYLGYKNVSSDRLELFDKALKTFRQGR